MIMIGEIVNNKTMKVTGQTKTRIVVGNVRHNLESRHIVADFRYPAIDEEEGTATFLLWNLSGQLVGFQQYRPFQSLKNTNNPREARYFTIRRTGTVAVWGCEYLHLSPNVVFVTEGIFDAMRFIRHGYSAVAVLGNDPSNDTANWLHSLGRMVFCVLDNDKAGSKLAKVGNMHYVMEDDAGSATEQEIQKVISVYETANNQGNHLRQTRSSS